MPEKVIVAYRAQKKRPTSWALFQKRKERYTG
jgi:hypothetical protein